MNLPTFLNPITGESQRDQRSYIGGKPRLPAGCAVPTCDLCGAAQTFFFQLDVSESAWSEETISAFACTRCADERYLIPAMLEGNLRGADVHAGFLVEYQKNFQFLSFPTQSAVLLADYEESVEFRALEHAMSPARGCFGKIGGDPAWVYGDESPDRYAGIIPMGFIAEIYRGWQFTTGPTADSQIELDIRGRPVESPLEYYQLFLGNAVFLFGTLSGETMMYAVTQ